jgi:single-strand DNA-binding protein
MARSLNKVMLIGNLGRDAETKFTAQGTPVTKFSIATTRRWKDQASGEWKDETDWHNVTLWRNESVAPYLTKGKQVYIEGRLRTSSYDDKDGQKRSYTEVVAEEVMLLGGRGDGGSPEMGGEPSYGQPVSMPRGAQQQRRPGGSPPAQNFDPGIGDDDIPF